MTPSRRNGPYGMTEREVQVVMMLVNGYTDAEIARMMGLRPNTIKFHCTAIYQAMGVRGRTEAAVRWVREQEFKSEKETT